MAQGFQFSGYCYANLPQAKDAYFGNLESHMLGSDYSIGSTHIYKYVPIDGVWKLEKTTVDNATGALSLNFTVDVPQPSFNQCEVTNDPYTNFMDGNQLGWMVGLVMVAVYVIRRPYR